MDAPVGGSSPLEYGISPEGFVTGGLNHLLTLLTVLGCLIRGLLSTSPLLPPGRGITEPLGVFTGLPELDPGVLIEPFPEMRKSV